MFRKMALGAIVAYILVSFISSSMEMGMAMGSGNKYSDLQTGVTYSVYQPTNTLGLPPLTFQVRPCRLHPGHDALLLAGFGGMDHGIALVETSAQYNCTGLDNPRPLPGVTINGIKAKVGIYCIVNTCKASDFSQYGGEITFITAGTKTLKPTFIRVGTQGGFTLNQLIAFSKGLKLVNTK
jgi:hypothetical protein